MPIITDAMPKATSGAELARLFLAGQQAAQNQRRMQTDERAGVLRLALALAQMQDNRAEDQRRADRETAADTERKAQREADTELLLGEMNRIAAQVPEQVSPDFVGPAGPGRVDPQTQERFRGASPQGQRAMLSSFGGSVDDQIKVQAKQRHEREKAASVRFLMDELGGVDENGVPVSKAGKALLAQMKMKELGFNSGTLGFDDLQTLNNPAAAGAMKPVDTLRVMRIKTAPIDAQIKQLEALRNPITRMFVPVVVDGRTITPEELQARLLQLHEARASVLEQFSSEVVAQQAATDLAPLVGPPMTPTGAAPTDPMGSPLGAGPVPAQTAAPATGVDYQLESTKQLQRLMELRRQATQPK